MCTMLPSITLQIVAFCALSFLLALFMWDDAWDVGGEYLAFNLRVDVPSFNSRICLLSLDCFSLSLFPLLPRLNLFCTYHPCPRNPCHLWERTLGTIDLLRSAAHKSIANLYNNTMQHVHLRLPAENNTNMTAR